MEILMKLLLVVLMVSLTASCTWVKVSEEAKMVQVRDINDVSDCNRLGETTAMSKAKVAGVTRKVKKFEGELETIARNRAVKMNGNTIAAKGPAEGDEQVFVVLSCP
jgi:hypothetical protein